MTPRLGVANIIFRSEIILSVAKAVAPRYRRRNRACIHPVLCHRNIRPPSCRYGRSYISYPIGAFTLGASGIIPSSAVHNTVFSRCRVQSVGAGRMRRTLLEFPGAGAVPSSVGHQGICRDGTFFYFCQDRCFNAKLTVLALPFEVSPICKQFRTLRERNYVVRRAVPPGAR